MEKHPIDKPSDTLGTRQRDQAELIDAAKKLPGVEETLAVYGRLTSYLQPPNRATVVRFASRGNP